MPRQYRMSEAERDRRAERMRRLNQDPEFAAANAERMRRLNQDPEFNPLAALSAAQKQIYRILRRKGVDKEAALQEAKR